MSYTIIKDIKHSEWLAQRGKGIGSSEVGTILGLNRFESPYQLWLRKTGQSAPQPENFFMRAGHYLEDAVSKFYEDESGKKVIKASAGDWLAVDNDKPFLRVSPDRTYWISDSRSAKDKGIVECKTTQMQIDPADLPKSWFCQLQYQLGVMGYTEGALAWLTAGREFGYQSITFDADFYGWMIEQVEQFWTDCIIGGQEPAITRVEDILLRSPRSTMGKAIIATPEVIEAHRELLELKAQIAELDTRKKQAEEIIKLAMADAELLTSDTGDTLATWKSAKDSVKFNEKKFAAEHPEEYENYKTTVAGSRRFLIK